MGVPTAWMVVWGALRNQAEQYSKLHSSMASASVPASWLPSGVPALTFPDARSQAVRRNQSFPTQDASGPE